MKFEEVNKIYTNKVSEWIAKGYWINTGTMGGSQGEYAHIDLTNGTELIRILIEDGHEADDDTWDYFDTIVLTVGRCTDNIRLGDTDRLGNTVWNNHLEPIERIVWYKSLRRNSNWLMSREEKVAQSKIRRERRDARGDNGYRVFENAAQIVKPFVNRQKGFKGAKLSDITKVEKRYDTDWNGKLRGASYYVTVKGKRFELK